jgi:hypothetical protein
VCSRHANHGNQVTPAHPAGGKPGRGPSPAGGTGADLADHLVRFLTSYDRALGLVLLEVRQMEPHGKSLESGDTRSS